MTYYLTTTARHKGAKRQIQRRARDIGTLKRTAIRAKEANMNIWKKQEETVRLGISFVPVMLDEGAHMPYRAHPTDAGLDLRMPDTGDITLFAHESVTIDTGVHVLIPAGYVGMLKSKSGLNVKYGITSEGVIDAGYTGSIVVKLYNNSDNDHCIHMGDKISQLVILPIITPDAVLVESFPTTDRGNNGFGSTGI